MKILRKINGEYNLFVGDVCVASTLYNKDILQLDKTSCEQIFLEHPSKVHTVILNEPKIILL